MSGSTSYHAGHHAEGIIETEYRRRGLEIIHKRWRGQGGEIDLIARNGDGFVFIEVKKSATHAQAAERLSAAQARRIMMAAQEFVVNEPRGLDTDMRFDVALVDAAGRAEVLENALAA